MVELLIFKWQDYLVFGCMLFISSAIGFYIGWKDRSKKSTKDYLLGGGDLKVSTLNRKVKFFTKITDN